MRQITIVLIFKVALLQGQDFHLSQYDAAPLYLNPAMTGAFDGDYRLHAHYRSQWGAIATKPFQTTALSFDKRLKKISAGGQLLNYRAGAGNYNALSLLASASKDWALDSASYHHLSFGIQAGFIHISVNINNLSFGNQYEYNSATGGGFNSSISNEESNFNQSDFLHDVNAGLLYYFAKNQTRINPFLGLTAFHLSQTQESFYGKDNKLPMRFLFHGGIKLNVAKNIQLLPKAFYMMQTNDREITYSMMIHYYLTGSDAFLIVGSTVRNKDAAIFEVGMRYGKYTCRISYDINTSTLKPSTDGKGGIEISLTLIQPKQKPNPVPSCPRL